MPFFEFKQNNTGGSFEVNEMVCNRVVIEAENAEEANRIAMDMGIYFDGVAGGLDCGCCGDRWYPQDKEEEGNTYPMEYGRKTFKTPEEHYQSLANKYGWTTPDIRIYYADGKTVSEIVSKGRRAA